MMSNSRFKIRTRLLSALLGAAFLFSLENASAARAGAIQLINGIDPHGPVKVDGNDGYVYFGQLHTAGCTGEMDRAPVNGGSLGVIATGLSGVDGGTCRGLNEILFSTDPGLQAQRVLYGWSIGNASSTIAAADLSGSNPIDLVSEEFADLKGAYGGNVYYPSLFQYLSTVPIGGGASDRLLSGYFIRDISIDLPDPNYPSGSDGVFFINYYDDSVYRSALASGPASPLIQSVPDEGTILTDSRNVYLRGFSDSDRLIEAGKGASCTIPNCLSLFSDPVSSFVVDESESDNPAGSVFVSDGSNLWRVAKTGGAQLMHAGTGLTVLQTDGAKVYFIDGQNLRTLPVNAITSDKPVTYASGVHPDFWTLDNGFYWTDDGDGTPGSGSVYYIAQQASQYDRMRYSSAAAESSLKSCASVPAVYTALARTVLEAQGQHVPATGVKIDDFYRITDAGNPCGSGGGAPDWSGNGAWQNPVQSAVAFGSARNVTASTDLSSLVNQGPVMIQGENSVRWMLLTSDSSVPHGAEQVSGISAYDPLSGSRVLFQFDSGTGKYKAVLILDPRANVWCAWTADCPRLVSDIHTSTLNFNINTLGIIENFVPRRYIATTVRP
jgi:hypothetical protein